jgi:predicted membrane protein
MEFFLPSVFILLVAAAVVFFVIPRFGPSVLAAIALVLLIMGAYQHYHTFGTEYRLSTWQYSFIPYASYILVGGLIFAILVYLLYLLPANSTAAASPVLPTIASMPSANTATNPVTAGVNKAINAVSNVLNTSRRNNRSIIPFSQV